MGTEVKTERRKEMKFYWFMLTYKCNLDRRYKFQRMDISRRDIGAADITLTWPGAGTARYCPGSHHMEATNY
jgi:hypothetical protein